MFPNLPTPMFVETPSVGLQSLYTSQVVPAKYIVIFPHEMPSLMNPDCPGGRRLLWTIIGLTCVFFIVLFRFLFEALFHHRNSGSETPYAIPTFTPEPYNMPGRADEFLDTLHRSYPRFGQRPVPAEN